MALASNSNTNEKTERCSSQMAKEHLSHFLEGQSNKWGGQSQNWTTQHGWHRPTPWKKTPHLIHVIRMDHQRIPRQALHWEAGMCSRTTWSRPRPGVFKAKAAKFCPRGVLEVEASPRGPPSRGFLPHDAMQRAVMPRRLSVHHSQIQRPTAASCVLVYEVLYLWYWVLYLHSKIQRLTARPRSQSQGRASSRPRPRPRPGHTILSSRCPRGRGQSSRTPSLVFVQYAGT